MISGSLARVGHVRCSPDVLLGVGRESVVIDEIVDSISAWERGTYGSSCYLATVVIGTC